ncbi:MAG: radical SAM protein [Candidatus Aminicenantes bacterium]|nr:radical SAM protein [Candidatus Aminicenantes bacterium]
MRNTVKLAGGMLKSAVLRKPSLKIVSLYLTYRCNQRCAYCGFPDMVMSELTTSQWENVIDQLANLGCRRVGILGGEPLLRSDLQAIIAHVKRRGMSCVLTSNGLLVPERIEELRQLDHLVLSLDAAGPENDLLRGQGSYAAVKEAMAAAKAAGIAVKINAVLSANTASNLDGLLSFVEENEIYITINIARRNPSEQLYFSAEPGDRDEKMREMLTKIARLTRSRSRIVFSEASYLYASRWKDFSINRYQVDELSSDDPCLINGPHCQAGRFYMSILPDGSTSPCVVTIGEIQGGNVIQDGVAGAWKSLVDHKCGACNALCSIEQNYLFSLHPRVLTNFVARHLPRFS